MERLALQSVAWRPWLGCLEPHAGGRFGQLWKSVFLMILIYVPNTLLCQERSLGLYDVSFREGSLALAVWPVHSPPDGPGEGCP